jgi:3-hydroxyisobutyrate dehydrogenase-like beta-hydroxyacid dehydrogenase
MSKKKIGLVGAGLMGYPMALHWLKAGYPLNVLPHKNMEKINDLKAKGARVVLYL